MVSMFTIKAGMSALYSCESSNKVSLKLHFESVPVDLRCRRASLELTLTLISALTLKKIPLANDLTTAIFAVKDQTKIKEATTFVTGLADSLTTDQVTAAIASLKTKLGIPNP
jgi:hypothetical protein